MGWRERGSRVRPERMQKQGRKNRNNTHQHLQSCRLYSISCSQQIDLNRLVVLVRKPGSWIPKTGIRETVFRKRVLEKWRTRENLFSMSYGLMCLSLIFSNLQCYFFFEKIWLGAGWWRRCSCNKQDCTRTHQTVHTHLLRLPTKKRVLKQCGVFDSLWAWYSSWITLKEVKG